ncbi:MAG: hypothetical protein C3F19_06400 [Rhodocyclales bacterium]|nr:MAG: hypothetical protein C3F19_06400 [Rhodocyclales bacterium]
MTACLLWPLPEAARQLGGLSVRTVRRLIERGEIPMVRVGRRVTVPAEAVRAWVARGMSHAHNSHRAGRGAGNGGSSRCHTSARTVRSGGSASSTHVGRELDALLEPRTGRKQKL